MFPPEIHNELCRQNFSVQFSKETIPTGIDAEGWQTSLPGEKHCHIRIQIPCWLGILISPSLRGYTWKKLRSRYANDHSRES